MTSTLDLPYRPIVYYDGHNSEHLGKKVLNNQQLNRFLQDVERRAYKMAMIATRRPEEALDIVQDAMMRLVQSYAHKPQGDWPALFYRILHNRIMDWHRKRKLENTLFRWLPGKKTEIEAEDDSEDDIPDHTVNPEDINQGRGAIKQLEEALHHLPPRQRQAFLLRSWEGMSTAETAQIMGCSEGSVKTHFSRAMVSLKETLGEHWP